MLKDTWFKFSALLWAFIYSIIVANLIPVLSRDRFQAGLEFSSGQLLRLSICLLGLTVSASVWTKLGIIGLTTVLINLVFTYIFGILFCRYILRLSAPLSILIGVGTSICGASAIAATGPAIKAKAEEMGLSLAVITLFGLVAMFTFPLLFTETITTWLENNPLAFGMWAGTGIHETAQVIAAASQIEGALSIAASAKFIRIFMIGPMVFISLYAFRYLNKKAPGERVKISVPWFALGFIALSLVHFILESLPIAEPWLVFNSQFVKPSVTFLLAWAFAGVGLKVKVSTLRAMGLKAFIGGFVVALVAGISALLLVIYLWLPLSN